MKRLVPPFGPPKSPILLIGEAPGEEEAFDRHPKPFVGAAGRHQEELLNLYGCSSTHWRKANVIQEYTPGNPDPTPEQIQHWTPILEQEIRECSPTLIIAAGKFACEWLLGYRNKITETCHGVLHKGGCFDPQVAHRCNGAYVLPIRHPALGLHVFKFRAHNMWDYEQVARFVKLIGNNAVPEYTLNVLESQVPFDEYPESIYKETTGVDLSRNIQWNFLSNVLPSAIGIDTEGTPDNPWSIQICFQPGQAWVLRCSDESFKDGIEAIQTLVNCGVLIVLHDASTPNGAGWDITVCRAMGLNLLKARIFNTMYASYLLGTEPWSLDALCWRHLGMHSTSYTETMHGQADQKQIDYLKLIRDLTLPRPQATEIRLNNGMSKSYRPLSKSSTAKSIIQDWENDKRDRDGNPIDIMKRWVTCTHQSDEGTDILHGMRMDAEFLAGGTLNRVQVGKKKPKFYTTRMPDVGFDDLPLDVAIQYAGSDADGTLRLYPILQRRLEDYGMAHLMESGVEVIKILEQYQQCGVPASRVYFSDLSDRFSREMRQLQDDIIAGPMDDEPFNPNSSPDAAKLCQALGLPLSKRTLKGQLKTDKGVLEQFRYSVNSTPHQREYTNKLFGYRERSKRKGTYCAMVLDNTPLNEDISTVHFPLGITTATRRLAGPLLTLPVRQSSEADEGFGLLIRNGYVAPPGYLFFGADYSGWEFRVFAHVTQDPLLLSYFIDNLDPHTETAKRIFGVETPNPEQRRVGKIVNFATIYGAYGGALLQQFQQAGLRGYGIKTCNGFVDKFYESHVGAAQYKVALLEQIRQDKGIVSDHWGMKRRLPGVFSHDPQIVQESVRKGVSQVSQGTAQGAVHHSMIHLQGEVDTLNTMGYDIRVFLQMHDELDMWFRDDEDGSLGDVKPLLQETVYDSMLNHNGLELSVPVKVDGHFSDRWGGLK